MVKLIESSQFADVPEIGAKFAEFNSPAMKKEAETIFGRSYESLKPTDDKYVGIHLVALGDEEHYGPNRNQDGFSKESCIRDHDTFVKHGHVFAHHHNNAEKDPILGAIKASAYNEKMGRIELFIWADKEKAKEGLDQLEKNGEASFSMATRVPYDECFPKGTLVQTPDGYKEIETIESGDFVISADGNKCRVVATSVRMASKITTVKAGGLPLGIRSTANHPYRVVRADIVHGCCGSVSGERRRHKFIGTNTCTFCHKTVGLAETWVAAGELTRHDYLAVDVPSCSEVDTVGPQFAYVAGQYTGDGSTISERRGRDGTGEINLMGISFSLSKAEKDYDITDRLTKATVAVCGEKPQLHADGDKGAWVAHLYDQSVAVRVVELVGAGSKTKRITDVVHRWSRREKIAFLSGLIDSDGCVSPEKGMTRVCTSSRSLALGVQQLCWSVGIPATCYVTTYGQSNEHSIRGVYFSSGVAYGVQFSTYVPELFEFSAKLARHPDITGAKRNAMRVMLACGRAYLPVDSVETHDADPIAVYNIEVEDDHTYNAEGAAVHNCSICGARRKNSSDPNMCDHIRNQLGKMAEDGKIAYMRNVVNDWFDISFVTRPADRIAYSLKVADEQSDGIATSEALAKAAGIVEPPWLEPGLVADKRAVLRKLADAYEDHVREPLAHGLFGPVAKEAESRLDDATIETLRKMPVKEAMAFLLDSGTFLGPRAFCRYAMGSKSAEFAEVGPRSAEVGRLAAQAIKEAAWLDRFDFTQAGDFDVDRFTTRPSTRFAEVARAGFAVKRASFDEDNILDLVAASNAVEKTAEDRVDGMNDFCFNTVDKPILAVALKYAEYKVAALNAALSGTFGGGTSNTRNGDALLALVAAQDL